MGLLDDAIRDHLDLKRRRGADPAELQRAEREALGPVRRKGDVAATGYAADPDEVFELDEGAVTSGPPAAYDQAADNGWDEADDELAVDEPEPEPEPEPRRRLRRSVVEDDADRDQPRGLAARFGLRGRHTEEADELEPEADGSPPSDDEPTRVHRAGGSGAGPTGAAGGGLAADHDVVEPPEEQAGDDDMLEETPEFLQDTPDHDRLWFEQRPPRDFDFDG